MFTYQMKCFCFWRRLVCICLSQQSAEQIKATTAPVYLLCELKNNVQNMDVSISCVSDIYLRIFMLCSCMKYLSHESVQHSHCLNWFSILFQLTTMLTAIIAAADNCICTERSRKIHLQMPFGCAKFTRICMFFF